MRIPKKFQSLILSDLKSPEINFFKANYTGLVLNASF